MSISNRSFACENDGPLKRNCTLESSQSVARAQWLWHFALAAANAVLKNSQGTKVVLTFVSQHNHSLFAHGTFPAHGGQPDTKGYGLKTLGSGGCTRFCKELADFSAQTLNQELSHWAHAINASLPFLTDSWDSGISPHCPKTTQSDGKKKWKRPRCRQIRSTVW
ncbi:hypothetical protein B0I72DRAFT_45371 [Yarrowia lipolytica]|uniref:YALI0A06633p n=1 Tax=Yarrowia lipolytica (strain CLIB 122 / E 150) TaxID=284591 RepID=Q6CHP8_YARLI|nr:YALI0A06633p [Yarrowia lipolytica CLIB122]RDW31551.1 hypothetical protein B0I72DRAFT_45371 [Yarrowia lipolytica]RDW40566.1 hypothetical protein B0I73DRAFT_23084 [Yarrowia lipolytica]RDW44374.1 hypothetical protein B0I74DRAFT_47368 [Yarrowia lipolytica]RDW51250.1 hypothetical protein B0I75DRAFT_44737 [Yarrowia lipolytica]CAG83739.1 YALI0A06633p [Yarrowia lipolytica CLIB122]|eukprot:XP_499813.1 YALI0A06633p [Yarrowia lipolytica CLIB122]